MENSIESIITAMPLPALFLIIAASIYVLGKGADLLVEEAVAVSVRWGVPRVVVGATIVSLGTTFPEAAVSVVAALQGRPGLALGNAVGSVICDTGLVLGVAAVISPLPLLRRVVDRQGWLQLGAGVLLVVACIPWCGLDRIFIDGGVLPRWMGWVFLFLLCIYLAMSIFGFRNRVPGELAEEEPGQEIRKSGIVAFFRFLLSLAMILLSSKVLILAVSEAALRLGVPESVIAATLVAFGTSLPELVTAVTAVRKGHGELAVGNVIGADILNVFFVTGAAAAITLGGLAAPVHFFQVLFPAMLFVLIVFRLGILFSKDELKRPFGFILLGIYALTTLVSYSNLGGH